MKKAKAKAKAKAGAGGRNDGTPRRHQGGHRNARGRTARRAPGRAEKDKKKRTRRAAARRSAPPLMTKAVPSTGERLAAVGVGHQQLQPDDGGRTRRAARSARGPHGRGCLGHRHGAGVPPVRRSRSASCWPTSAIASRRSSPPRSRRADGNLAKGVAMIEESRRRLRTDVLDLVQIHSLNGVDVLFPHLYRAQAERARSAMSASPRRAAVAARCDGRAHQLAADRFHPGGLLARQSRGGGRGAAGGAREARRRADQPALRRAARWQPVLARRAARICRNGRRRSTRAAGARCS